MPANNQWSYLIEDLKQYFYIIRERWLIALFVWTFLFAGIAVLGWGIWQTQEALSSRSWPKVTGTITRSEVASYQSTSDEDNTTMFYPYLRYLYTVDGQQYTGEKVDLGEYSSSDRGYAEKVVARYPVGLPVTVFYEPAHPSTAVLEPGFTRGLWIPLSIGALFSIIGGGMTFFFFRWVRQERDKY